MAGTPWNKLITSDYPIKRKNSARHGRLTLRDQFGEGCSLEHPQVGIAHGFPLVVDGTGINLRALGPAENAARPATDVLDGLHDLEQRDVPWRTRQAEAAAQPLLR